MNLELWTTLLLSASSLIAGLLLYVWTAIALAAVFRKSGEAAWKAWVPVLNAVLLLRIAGLSGWLVLVFLVPVAGFVLLVVATYRVNVAFGRGIGMTVLAALLFPVWATVLGFGPDRWVGREAARGPVRSAGSDIPPAYSRSTPAPAPAVPTAGAPREATALPAWTPPPLPSSPAPSWAPEPAPGRLESTPLAAPPATTPPAPAAASPTAPSPTAPSPTAPSPALPAVDPAPPLRRSAPAASWADADDDGASWDADFAGMSSTGEVTDAVIGAPAPVSAAPIAARGRDADDADDDDEPPVTSVAAAPAPAAMREPWAPAPSPFPAEGEAFPESSGLVSAIAGAPEAGTPRSARSSVSAMHAKPHIPEEDDVEATVIARRKRTAWTLTSPSGARIPLTSTTVILGRRPAPDPAHPDAQLVSLDDDTRTVSKTHALLELRDDRWYITDLDSTNGVLFSTLLGTEVAAMPGEATEAGDRFLLGDAEVSLARSDG